MIPWTRAFLVMIISASFVMGCSSDSPSKQEDVDLPAATEDIGAAGGEIRVDDEASPLAGYSVEVPENALTSSTDLEIWEVSASTEGPASRTEASLGFALKPSNVVFGVPARVTIPMDSVPEEVAIYRHVSGAWSPLLPTTAGPAGLSAPTPGSGSFQAFRGLPPGEIGETLDPATAKCGAEVLDETSFGECAFVRWFWSVQDEPLMAWDPIETGGKADSVALMAHDGLQSFREPAKWGAYAAPDDAIAFGLHLALSDPVYEPQLLIVLPEGTPSSNPHTLLVYGFDAGSASLVFQAYDPYSTNEHKQVELTFDGDQLLLGGETMPGYAHLYGYITSTVALSAVYDAFEGGNTTPPAAVTDLAAGSPTPDAIELTWTAPGDNGGLSPVSTYDLRYSTQDPAETFDWWSQADVVSDPPAPQGPGASEAFTIEGLSCDTTYFFQMTSSDASGNESDPSNVATETTLDCGGADAYVQAARQALEDELYRHLQYGAPDPEAPDDVDFTAVLTNYEAALAIEPGHKEANFGVAVASLLTLTTDSEINAAFDEWRGFLEDGSPFDYNSEAFQPLGVPLFLANPQDAVKLPFQLAPGMAVALSGGSRFRADPDIADLQVMIHDVIAPRLQTAVLHLEDLLDDDTFVFTVTPRMRGDEEADPLEIDKTDVLVLSAACKILLGGCEAAQAYDLTVPSYDLPGIHAALDQNSGSMFRLRAGGDDHMAAVLPYFRDAAETLEAGITSLLSESDDQSDDYIKIGPRELDREQVLDWRDEHLPAIRAALDGASSHTLDWDNDNTTPDTELTVNLKAFFENPVEDFKAKAAPYTIETVPRPWGPRENYNLQEQPQIGPVTIPAGGGFYSVNVNLGWYDYEPDYGWTSGDPDLIAAATDYINSRVATVLADPHWAGYVHASVSFYGDLEAGEQMISVNFQMNYSIAETVIHVPVVVWEADDYASWVAGFPDPSVNGLFPEIADAGEFLVIMGYDPAYDWDKRLILDWTGIEWEWE